MTSRVVTAVELARITDPRAAALHYASLGWPVVPTAGIVSGRCGCRLAASCTNHVGKHPLNSGGVSSPTTDQRTIGGWWDRWPWAGVGIVTGPESGLLVVDVDLKLDGPATIERLKAQGIDLTQTLTAITGSGGRHYVFAAPDGRWLPSTVGAIPGVGKTPGVDLRGDGTFIVAAPSWHHSGGRYGWDESSSDLAPLPTALLDLMPVSAPNDRENRQPAAIVEIQDDEITPYAHKAFEGEVNRVRATNEERNATLFHAAKRLGRLVGGGQLPQDRVETELYSAGIDVGLSESETRRTIASGITTGLKEPRFPKPSVTPVRRSPRQRERQEPPGRPPLAEQIEAQARGR